MWIWSGEKTGRLGEMFSQLGQKGVPVPNGFITTSAAFWRYLKFNGIDKNWKGFSMAWMWRI